ncbi:hypothetical protein [Spongiactinospora sp. TRM90649]|uniref:hypothetical protein n=1 Tax=Spongiactinospora sp. TRM90649 TaxID=3031114 RepID=UPI0023F9AE7A|nr:hypothetical protein [Spongiactinospora sp. TRM90649]MDF5756930.1 hypothetical protein [Spongiactinospora sp. TRM90649]
MSSADTLEALVNKDVELSDDEVRRVFTAAFTLYARHLAERGYVEPFTSSDEITATDVVTVASALLHAQNLEVFELALWQSWGGVPWKGDR